MAEEDPENLKGDQTISGKEIVTIQYVREMHGKVLVVDVVVEEEEEVDEVVEEEEEEEVEVEVEENLVEEIEIKKILRMIKSQEKL
ncbi:hypothetical protein POVWA2_053000 [Plasmodium ovale wallikeri]|uniref:Uncharacterized protein n=1 Tax=Plasmodium ovale wallikeri TaxID=864142 RepID=A0A1A8ZR92_PLAOA|nr:hypothetical protein POVWA1_053740 [Plasmodium ovale wallikeri]SBT47000.1 hypothetical protein POVWA2_053000 [Plasmodium ovale wallikeri]